MRKSGKTFRCYVVYTKGSIVDHITTRKGPVHWVAAMDAHQAREYVDKVYVRKEMGAAESVDRIIATAWAEDKALNAQGYAKLPMDFDKA